MQETRNVAAEEPVCPGCGKPLTGRDRYEGQCAACREAEILAAAPPPEPPDARELEDIVCRACGASNAPGLDACAECGEPLAAGSHRAPLLRIALAAVLLAAAGAAAYFLWPRTPRVGPANSRWVPPAPRPAADAAAGPDHPIAPVTPAPPVPAQAVHLLEEETRVLLELLAAGNYSRVIDNYAQPDESDFRRVERALRDIVAGEAEKGFVAWCARLSRLGGAAGVDVLAQAGAPCPAYTAAFLTHLSREPEASSAQRASEDRARNVLRWHLVGLFDGLNLAEAEPGAIHEPRPGRFSVDLACEGRRTADWLPDEPSCVLWTRLPVGWVVKLSLADRIERIRDFLARRVPEQDPAVP